MAATPDLPTPHPAPATVPEAPASLFDAARRWAGDPDNRPTVLGVVACLAIFALLFQESLGHFYYAWTTDDNYSHGFLVPLLSLYFASQVYRREGWPAAPEGRSGVWLGGVLLGGALLVHLLTIPLPIPFLGDLALLAGLAGGFTILAGAAALRRFWFVFSFLIFMVPLPIALYSRIASPLQLMASRVASSFMNATGVPVLCEGNRMTLPGGVQMFVAEACSGMRQLTGFLALAAAVAYLTRRPRWYKAVVVLSALPIALFANTTRVVVTGYIMHYVNPAYAEGAYHTLEGILLMSLGLLLLNSVCVLMDLFCVGADGASPTATSTEPEPEAEPDPPAGGRPRSGGWSSRRVAGPLSLRTATEELS
ncbi:exosortase/archaeosortase family protein [Planctomyces sp. SH-PL62]|uniref:exosortase/archaeosortase family protein n=1 Tax=Planctomyces sp. SH-PL62 TaxID=1636152 RepID=UPI00078D2C1A|nr:exosortase/archaeosortase family protein [Planctomyces sp. SH-PL62]AMV35805.1 Transmembrane exosortase [Planctomyces sp. SH-PL62]